MTDRLRALLDEEEKAWRDLATRFEALTDEDWSRPGVNGDWTPKDLLAHIACWHSEAESRLEGINARGEEPGPLDPDVFNKDSYERCMDLRLADVRAMAAAARHRYREECARLQQPISERAATIVAANGHLHYAEHVEDFDRFLGR